MSDLPVYWLSVGRVTDPAVHNNRAPAGALEFQFSDAPRGLRTMSHDYLSLEEGLAALCPCVIHLDEGVDLRAYDWQPGLLGDLTNPQHMEASMPDTTYPHVANPSLRALLAGDTAPTRKALRTALDYSSICITRDARNTSIPFAVVNARQAALEHAEDAFDDADYEACLTHLRNLWSV